MKKIVLLRHGESVWNKENRFTGWTDVDLSEKGVAEAVKAGETLRKEGFCFGCAYTSYLKRAVKTLDAVLDKMDQDWIPILRTSTPFIRDSFMIRMTNIQYLTEQESH